MGLRDLSGAHILILVGVFVVLFGARRLPDGARSLGRSLRIFKSELRGLSEDEAAHQKSQAPASAPGLELPTPQYATGPVAPLAPAYDTPVPAPPPLAAEDTFAQAPPPPPVATAAGPAPVPAEPAAPYAPSN